MRVIVVGGTGTIGSVVVVALSARYEVVAVGRTRGGAGRSGLVGFNSSHVSGGGEIRCGDQCGWTGEVRESG